MTTEELRMTGPGEQGGRDREPSGADREDTTGAVPAPENSGSGGPTGNPYTAGAQSGGSGSGNSYAGNPYAGDTYPGDTYPGQYGYQGYSGYQGQDFQDGHQGYQGYQSYQGYPGYQPTPGYPGYQDPQGYPGYAGQPGYPGAAGYPGYPGYGYSPKSKAVGALLAFFLGTFGAHNFYFGLKNRAVTQLVLTLGSWAALVVGVIALAAGVDSQLSYDSEGYYSSSDSGDGTAVFGALLLVAASLTLTAVAIWAFVEFIMVLVGARTYARDAQGLIIR